MERYMERVKKRKKSAKKKPSQNITEKLFALYSKKMCVNITASYRKPLFNPPPHVSYHSLYSSQVMCFCNKIVSWVACFEITRRNI